MLLCNFETASDAAKMIFLVHDNEEVINFCETYIHIP